MSTFDYARIKATADRLIARFGQAATLRVRTTTGPAYNPTEGAAVDHACQVVVTAYDKRDIDGTRILETDRKVMLAAGSLTIAPATSHELLIGGTTCAIISVTPSAPGGTVTHYEMQVR